MILQIEQSLFHIGFYGWLVIIAGTIVLNWYRITKRGLKPHYFSANYSRAFYGLVCLILMSARDGFDGLDLFVFYTWIPYIPNIIYIISSFYLFFDAGLNGLRGKPIDYQGKDSGYFDKLKKLLYYTLKGLCLATLIYTLVILL